MLFCPWAPSVPIGATGLAARAAEAERSRAGRVIGLGRDVLGASTVTAGIASDAAWASASEPIGDTSPKSTGKPALPIARMRNIS
ncbi:hypothetical protein BwSH20_27410 [Bradyrhizobium ottawaense]|nr:hypothetical protein SG09_59880 [Bradyrhizobium ottawaense]GMO47406.1 hypothetical protein BwSF21_64810 [Bradyrhizobium ottawaense]GMO55664.1 hypothetical protein BwSF12_70360 [Bradyrhizobium ottawaense]GMO80577.1 hypothetical protein BwSG10_52830 [Bradyrhizobium ottawaense]GMO81685.1 hypothetical protein BwSH17_57050 [Bradyrhizobium ottawaense]